MTKDEAINKLIRIRQVQGSRSEAHEALGMAIDALSQSSLPANLDEAALASMPKPNGIESNTDFSFMQMVWMFEQGAKWMAGQGETVDGDVEGNWRNQEDTPYEIYVISDCLPKNTEFKFGDKVVVQIRKKQ